MTNPIHAFTRSLTPFAFEAQSGRHRPMHYIEARLSDPDHQHVQFMIYRRRVIETWPESASKTALLAAIESSIASLGRTEATCSAR